MPSPVAAVVASAGGVEALKRLVGGLPSDLPGTLLVALHLAPGASSLLAAILDRNSAATVREARTGEPLPYGEVRVAQPDAHLLVVDGRLALGRGARENGHRPSHDAMLRSVALGSGPAAVGAVLTGLLDDGTVGLTTLQRYGGTCLVQDPNEAEFPSMPEHALSAVPAARCVTLDALAAEVVRAMQESRDLPEPVVDPGLRARDIAELRSALGEPPAEQVYIPSPYACPDCHGVLNEVPDVGPLRFRCRTGHAWTAQSLLSQQSDDVETALWTALRTLEERHQIAAGLADAARAQGQGWSADL